MYDFAGFVAIELMKVVTSLMAFAYFMLIVGRLIRNK